MAIVLSTKEKALLESRALVQTYGFNGFSFQHVADALGIKKPSLYAHFKSKEELGDDLIEHYRVSIEAWAETISVFEPADKIGALFEKFYSFSCDKKKYCVIGALAADFNTLPASMQKALSKILKGQMKWLESVIEEGQKKKVFARDINALEAAETLMAMALGSQQVGRLFAHPDKIRMIKENAIRMLT